MKKKINLKVIWFLLGIIVCAAIYLAPINGLDQNGRLCLGMIIMSVIWWATQVAQTGFIGGLLLCLMVFFHLAENSAIFAAWTGSTIWLVIGAYLISGAVNKSGLGRRLSYIFILRFVKSWKSIILSTFALTLILSLLIPSPWPRAFLIMSVMQSLIKAANLKKEHAAVVGLAVFTASLPLSLTFYTGDASMSPLVSSYTGEAVSFVKWFAVMGVPTLVLAALTIIVLLVFFDKPDKLDINKDEMRKELQELGKLTALEKRVTVWMAIAILFWLTTSVTKIDIGFGTLAIAMLMSIPVIGGILDPGDWKEVPVNVLLFLTAAIAIGKVGAVCGVTSWMADLILKINMPSSQIMLALVLMLICLIVHAIMGSVMTVMSIIVPMFVAMSGQIGIPPLVIACLAELSIYGSFILPFHHINILVGVGENAGGYEQKECVKMGLLMIPCLAVTIVVSMLWWNIIGIL